MKHTLSRRDVDFMSALRHEVLAWDDTQPPTLMAVVLKVLGKPAPRFYVDYETAYRNVSLAMRDLLPHRLTGRRRQMWMDLAGMVLAVMSTNSGYSMSQALVDVLETREAPSFYISSSWAIRIYHNYRSISRSMKRPKSITKENTRIRL